MKTLTVDDFQRVRLPKAKPRSKFAYEDREDGTITLTPVSEVKAKEPFPPGSLAKYFTPERNKEEMAILKGCVQDFGAPPGDPRQSAGHSAADGNGLKYFPRQLGAGLPGVSQELTFG
jgi:hypothetical protein